MIEKNINGDTYLFVEVPESSGEYFLEDWPFNNEVVIGMAAPDPDLYETLPEGNYTIIGKASEISEEQWEEIVAIDELEVVGIGGYSGFVNYEDKNTFFSTATESGLSLIKSMNLIPPTTLIIKKQ